MESSSEIRPDDEVYGYLSELGYSAQQIAGMTMSTRMFHDLGSYGDTAVDEMSVLQRKFGVDLSEIDFKKYFPPEFEGKSKFDAFIRNMAVSRETRLVTNADRYEPLTLGMINRAMLAKRWRRF